MTLSIIFSLILISALGAMSPGPSLAVVAKHSLASGRLHGIVTSWSHSMGVGIHALLGIFGLAVVLKQSPTLFTAVSYAGAAYLAYLGVNALRSKGGIAAKLKAGESTTILEAARDGFMISLLNPKLALYFIALFSQFVALSSELSSRIIIVSTPIVIDGLWYTLIAVVLSRPKVLEKLRSKAQWIDRVSGVVLILLAARVVYMV